MKQIVAGVMCLFAVGCSNVGKPTKVRLIPAANADKAARFIVDCGKGFQVKNVGENGDGAAWIQTCRNSADDVYGVWVDATFVNTGAYIQAVPVVNP